GIWGGCDLPPYAGKISPTSGRGATLSRLRADVRPLVGRARELGLLARALDQLSTGSAGVVEVTGEPGIGKTRLLSELARLADQQGKLVLTGRAPEFERESPFGVLVEAIDHHLAGAGARLLETLAAGQSGMLAAVFPSLARDGTVPARVPEA